VASPTLVVYPWDGEDPPFSVPHRVILYFVEIKPNVVIHTVPVFRFAWGSFFVYSITVYSNIKALFINIGHK
jgi:hypothetical protein